MERPQDTTVISNMKSDSLGLRCWGHHKLLLSGVALNEREDRLGLSAAPCLPALPAGRDKLCPTSTSEFPPKSQQIWALCPQPPHCRGMPGHCSGLFT